METKETVMSSPEIDTRLCNYAINFSPEDMVQIKKIVQFQAEISFKAGIKEVVEWIQKYNMGLQYSHLDRYNRLIKEFNFIIPELEWQTELKEWGFGV